MDNSTDDASDGTALVLDGREGKGFFPGARRGSPAALYYTDERRDGRVAVKIPPKLHALDGCVSFDARDDVLIFDEPIPIGARATVCVRARYDRWYF